MENQKSTRMKNEMGVRIWNLAGMALGGLLLMAAAGCTCVSVNVGYPTSGPQMGPQRYAPAGGNFVPVQAVPGLGGDITICGNPVSGTYVRFHPPVQTPSTGDTGFRGYLWNVTAGKPIPSSAYYLQWFVTSANTGCCTPLSAPPTPPTDVTCPVTPGLAYRFTAHFKTGQIPPNNPTIELRGAWTH